MRLQQAQLVIAREYGFKSWRKLKSFVDARDAQNEATRELASLINEYNAANQPDVAPRKSASDGSGDDAPRCSVCHKSQHEVDELLAGPDAVFICNQCVELCAEIIADQTAAPS